MIELFVTRRRWTFRNTFRIAYRVRTEVETVEVRLRRGGREGRGEASGVSYRGETPESIVRDIEAIRWAFEAGINRSALGEAMPAGGARSALDCALWDLEAKESNVPVWELSGVDSQVPLQTSITISLGEPDEMASAAAALSGHRLLKLKLGGHGDLERVKAVRDARPDARLIVDANQAWDEPQLRQFVPILARLGVELIEQPLPAGDDELLRGYDSMIPLCADESCQTRETLLGLASKYQVLNLKLDKAGGFTEALALAREAKAAGFGLMAGCMASSSLGIAPAFVVGQLCDFVDLDAPLLIDEDQSPAVIYDRDCILPPPPELWG